MVSQDEIIMPHAQLVPHWGSIQTQLYARESINVYGCDEMNTQIIESLSDDEDSTYVASQARLFCAVAEITARESREDGELLPELLRCEKSLVAFKNVRPRIQFHSLDKANSIS